jgi:hypothetical protein
MANYLINLFKTAAKGDLFRTPDSPVKYTDSIAKLNASGANKTGTPATKINTTTPSLAKPAGNTKLPGQ